MSLWDQRYREHDFAYGREANDFLQQQAGLIPPSAVLCLAEGDGRNAVFLAKQGYAVHVVDLSAVGLEKSRQYAQRENTRISTEVADLAHYSLAPSTWEGIVSIFAHLPGPARKALHLQVAQALKPGGVFILEAFTLRQLEMKGTGGPGAERPDFFMSLQALREELPGLDFIHARELDREISEGALHQGLCAVVQLIARKP